MKIKNVLVIGGAGYVGSKLVPLLLKNNFSVLVFDLFIYGEDVLSDHLNLKKIKGDIRNISLLKEVINDVESIIHLACISNDPSFELDPSLGKRINYDSFEPLIKISKDQGVKKFIYASSSSVYGVKKEMNVHENMKLEPITDYSRFKAMCEDIVFKYSSKDFICTVLRPATVCGYSRRQRLDLVVNILSNHGFFNRKIKILGGEQYRPNIHIDDMCDSYLRLLLSENPIINGNVYNVGTENQKVKDLANTVSDIMGDDIIFETVPSNDDRSYHISSEKILKDLQFSPKRKIKDAVMDLKIAFEAKILKNTFENEYYFNIQRMKNINLI
jgi:nucleoside-diphosphate-sugar epimerase